MLSSSYSYSQKIHLPEEILLIMSRSATKYHIEFLDKEIKCPDYSNHLNTNDFYRVEENGNITVYKYSLNEKAKNNFELAETFFLNNIFDSALVYYIKTFEEDSTAYNALTYVGQCNGLMQKYDEAERIYKSVIDKNYIDYMAHWFLSDIYCIKKKWKDAAKEITIASVLNRNNPRILAKMSEIYKKANMKWNNFYFNPQYKLKDLGGTDSVQVLFDKTWMMYALVKAVWAFEYRYRESMEDVKSDFSTTEEWESLANLYIGLERSDYDFEDLPELAALENAIINKMPYSYIYYEIMLVKYPQAAYNFPRDVLDKIVDYVMRVRPGKD